MSSDLDAQITYYEAMLKEQTNLIARQETSIAKMRSVIRQKDQAFKMLAHFSGWVGTHPSIRHALERTTGEIVRFLDHKKALAFMNTAAPHAEPETLLCISARGHWRTAHPMHSPSSIPCLNRSHITTIGQGICVGPHTKDTPEIDALRQVLGLSFFVAAPVHHASSLIGILVGGVSPQEPVLRHMDEGDLATFSSLATLLGALLENTERVERAQAQFLSRMSHELRTPLNGILGYAEMIVEEEEGQEFIWHDELGRIQRCGAHMLNLVEQLLDISMDSRGTIQDPLAVTTFNFCEMLSELTQALTLKHGRVHPVRFTCEESSLCSDVEQVRKALHHVIDNALRFCPDDEVHILVAPTTTPHGIRCTVMDRGHGMDETQLESIFAPFFQVDESFTRLHDGAGLGLAVAHGCVSRLGGTIQVTSTLGEGSEFVLWFPGHTS